MTHGSDDDPLELATCWLICLGDALAVGITEDQDVIVQQSEGNIRYRITVPADEVLNFRDAINFLIQANNRVREE